MNPYFKKFIKDLIERAVKTFAQTMLSSITVEGATFHSVHWAYALSLSGVAAIASALTSIASYNVGEKGTCSIVKEK